MFMAWQWAKNGRPIRVASPLMKDLTAVAINLAYATRQGWVAYETIVMDSFLSPYT